MVLTTARFERGFSVPHQNGGGGGGGVGPGLAEKRYSDRRLRPWPPTYAEKMAKSRWLASGGAGSPGPGMDLGGVPMRTGGHPGSLFNGSVGGPGPGYRYGGPPPMLTRQKSDIFLNVKSSASVFDYNNNFMMNNMAGTRKVKNIGGLPAVVDSDSNLEEVRRMRRHSTSQHSMAGGGAGGQFVPHPHRLQNRQPTFFHLNSSSKSRSKSMDDFTSSAFMFDKYRTRNGKLLNNGTSVNSSHNNNANANNINSHHNNFSHINNINNSSSSPSHSGIHSNGGFRHYTNNFGSNNLNGGHSYSEHLGGGGGGGFGGGGGKFISMKNHSVDNLLEVDTNYESYYQ
ncbi:hypothetical protein pipiens_016880, partial [Culex pipiens pipiens]